MGAGYRGTFVISWSQTQIDGVQSAPLSSLQVGSAWSWSGEPVRVDGPASVLQLGETTENIDMRARAARMVRRLVGVALDNETPVDSGAALSLPETAGDPVGTDSCFVVTDGTRGYNITLIPVGPGVSPLLMFVDEVPPANADLWVVHQVHAVENPLPQADHGGGVICFTPGTQIQTPRGSLAVESLREGDMVQTRDSGAQPVCWIGSRRFSGARLFAMPSLRPIRLRPGAFGPDQPNEEILVSPGHRMVIRGDAAQALFNTPEVLVAARDLVNGTTVVRDSLLKEVTYIHLLLPRHEVLFANCLPTESFHPANTSLSTLDPEDRARLLEVLPEAASDPMAYGGYARRNLSKSEAAILTHDAA
ncbi:Hint domain-containing protein [Antarctobacter jejuensis]|uniref:Hint domain-containing protein n=1 Tax=Antarctobacter jejuensis TaxID=1439938 RepID=UPI003FD20959